MQQQESAVNKHKSRRNRISRMIIFKPLQKKTKHAKRLWEYFFLFTVATIIGLPASGCCPKQTHETRNALSADPPLLYVGHMEKSIQTKTVVSNDEISRSEKSEAFLIVDMKPRSTGSDPMPRRKLNRKKYISIRAKGGETQ